MLPSPQELLFPAAALAVVFLVLIPSLSVVSQRVLQARRLRTSHWARFGSPGTFALLVAPSALPVAWLASAALHQSLLEEFAAFCLIGHGPHASACTDAILLLGFVLSLILSFAALRAWRERPNTNFPKLADPELQQRIEAFRLPFEVNLVHNSPEPLFSVGWRSRRILLDACFARRSDDAMLKAALLHEVAHLRSHDPLRTFAVRFALALNPARRLLMPEFEHWRGAREACCDSDAVHHGGDALALAECLVAATRFSCTAPAHNVSFPSGATFFRGTKMAPLKLRVALLMQGPSRPQRSLGHRLLLGAMLATLVAPHLSPQGPLEVLHLEVENFLLREASANLSR